MADGKRPFDIWLGELLAATEVSQTDLARLIGTNPSTVSGWMSGRSLPTARNCDAIARSLGIDRNEVRRQAGRREVRDPVPGSRRRSPSYQLLVKRLATEHAGQLLPAGVSPLSHPRLLVLSSRSLWWRLITVWQVGG